MLRAGFFDPSRKMNASSRASKRQMIFVAAKVLFAAAVITWLFHKADLSRVWGDLRNARPMPILLGIILTLATVAIAGWRWRLLLRIFGIDIPLKSLICIAQVGQFF